MRLKGLDEPTRERLGVSPGAPCSTGTEDAIRGTVKLLRGELLEETRPPEGRPTRAGARWTRRCRTQGERLHEDTEEAEWARWQPRLIRILREVDAPSSKVAELCLDPDRAISGLAGQARARALKAYVCVGEALRGWPPRAHGIVWLQGPGHVLDYLRQQGDEQCRPVWPGGATEGPTRLEEAAGRTGARSSSGRDEARKEMDKLTPELSHGRGSGRRAPRFPSAIIAAMEVRGRPK